MAEDRGTSSSGEEGGETYPEAEERETSSLGKGGGGNLPCG